MSQKSLREGQVDWLGRAVDAHRAGRLAEAEAAYRELLEADPTCPTAPINLGALCRSQGRLAEARQIYERALPRFAGNALLRSNYGNVLLDVGEAEQALEQFERALEAQAVRANAHYGRGIALYRLGRLGPAGHAFQTTIEQDPRHAQAHDWLGVVLLKQRRIQSSIPAFERALELAPKLVSAWRNLAGAYKAMNQLDRSFDAYRRALQLDPNHAEAHFGYATALLYSGDFERGWAELEWRYRIKGREGRLLGDGPSWNGSELSSKTLWLYTEQGSGDAIQFVRYTRLLHERGIHVRLTAPPCLESLFSCLPDVSLVRRSQDHDAHCPVHSLPFVLKTRIDSIPARVPYLQPPRAARERRDMHLARRRASAASSPKLGVCWAGNPEHTNDQQRSLDFEQLGQVLSPLLESHPELQCFSFQVGQRAWQLGHHPLGRRIVDLAPHLGDYGDTAAWIEEMDLVISVDTSVAHLAGALSRPVWILLPFLPDWRWLQERCDSPWYPSARLFRQARIDDWDSVLEQLSTALAGSPLLFARQ